jgi:hypothetical protein
MGMSKKDLGKHKADKQAKMDELAQKAASGSASAKKKLAKLK